MYICLLKRKLLSVIFLFYIFKYGCILQHVLNLTNYPNIVYIFLHTMGAFIIIIYNIILIIKIVRLRTVLFLNIS